MQRSSLNRRCQPSVTYTDIQVTEKSRRDLRGCQLTLYSLKYGLYAIFRGPCLNVTRVFSSHVKTSGSGYLHDSPLRKRTKDVTLLAASHGSVCNTKEAPFAFQRIRLFVLLVLGDEADSIMPTCMLLRAPHRTHDSRDVQMQHFTMSSNPASDMIGPSCFGPGAVLAAIR